MGGVRPNASENGQISPSTTVRAARTDGSRPNLTSILQEAGKPRIFKPVWESSGESRLIVLARIGSQDPAQMCLAQDDEMVHALAPDRPDQPFGKAIPPGRSW